MRLLLTTQKVDRNDDVLGFVHRWIEEIAAQCEQVTVVCLYEGAHALPKNVRVFSLGKERGGSRLSYVLRFWRYIIRERKNYTHVLVHMNPEYVALGGIFWRLSGKKIGLWYSHKMVTLPLKIAVMFAHVIFTTARMSVTFNSPKIRPVGHGIDVEGYRCPPHASGAVPVLSSVGRITPIKQCEVLIEAGRLLHEGGLPSKVVLVGKPVTPTDVEYDAGLRKQASSIEGVEFTGSVPLDKLRGWYCKSDIVVNMVPTGGFDKTVLEGMAAGCLVLSSNEAFREYFGPYGDRLIFKSGDAAELAERAAALWRSPDREEVRAYLLESSKQFGVGALIAKLCDGLRSL